MFHFLGGEGFITRNAEGKGGGENELGGYF